jgi:ABC-type multidrug transport system ATPase subunit
VAIVPEGRHVFPNLSVDEHLRAFARPRPGSAPRWTVEALYGLFPRLAERKANAGNQLSGGEQQMLAIARALSTHPRLLILDEATEGLAPVIREEIWHCIATLKAEGEAILVVDKYVQRLLPLANRHVILERGRVVWQGDSPRWTRTARCGRATWASSALANFAVDAARPGRPAARHVGGWQAERRRQRERDGGVLRHHDRWLRRRGRETELPRRETLRAALVADADQSVDHLHVQARRQGMRR